jgi:hypothetical protein
MLDFDNALCVYQTIEVVDEIGNINQLAVRTEQG